MGVDWYDANFYAVSGQVALQADLTPFSSWGSWGKKIVVTPVGFVGIGTPFGSTSVNGNLETIAAAGANVHLAKVFGGNLGVGGVYGTRSGLDAASGVFYGGFLNLTWRF
jgi:hypothetical protein